MADAGPSDQDGLASGLVAGLVTGAVVGMPTDGVELEVVLLHAPTAKVAASMSRASRDFTSGPPVVLPRNRRRRTMRRRLSATAVSVAGG
jgi:hypothetical protein